MKQKKRQYIIANVITMLWLFCLLFAVGAKLDVVILWIMLAAALIPAILLQRWGKKLSVPKEPRWKRVLAPILTFVGGLCWSLAPVYGLPWMMWILPIFWMVLYAMELVRLIAWAKEEQG